MLCYTDDTYERQQHAEEVTKVKAVLCALINRFGLEWVGNQINFQAAGTTRVWLLAWWEEHMKKDKERQARAFAAEEFRRQRTQLRMLQAVPDEDLLDEYRRRQDAKNK